MEHIMLKKKFIKSGLVLMTCYLAAPIMVSHAKNLIYTPDGRTVEIKGGVTQPDLSAYRSPLDSKVVDRRFNTNDATFLANESFKFGMEGSGITQLRKVLGFMKYNLFSGK